MYEVDFISSGELRSTTPSGPGGPGAHQKPAGECMGDAAAAVLYLSRPSERGESTGEKGSFAAARLAARTLEALISPQHVIVFDSTWLSLYSM